MLDFLLDFVLPVVGGIYDVSTVSAVLSCCLFFSFICLRV